MRLEPGQAELVDLRGPLALAQADGQHLEQAALVPSGERGVRLDPVEQDDAVGLDRRCGRSGSAGRSELVPEHDRVHLGADRAADGVLGDAELGQERLLARRRCRRRGSPSRRRRTGAKPSPRRVSTAARAIRSMPAIPRLPTVSATEPPGRTRAAIRLPRIAAATAAGTSATSGWTERLRGRGRSGGSGGLIGAGLVPRWIGSGSEVEANGRL